MRLLGPSNKDAEIVFRVVARRPGLPGATDAGVADKDAEGRSVVVGSVVVGDEPAPGVDDEHADGAGPAADLWVIPEIAMGRAWVAVRRSTRRCPAWRRAVIYAVSGGGSMTFRA